MSKALHLVSPPKPDDRAAAGLFDRLGGAQCHWAVLGDGAVLVVGSAPDRSVRLLARPGPVGSPTREVHPEVWARPGGPASCGFAAIVAPKEAGGRIGALSLATSAGQAPIRLPREPAPIDDLVEALATDCGPAFGDVVEALVEALAGGPAGPVAIAAAALLLRKAARPSGYVEIVAELDGASFVQGWSSDLAAGHTRLVILGDTVAFATVDAGTFARADLEEGAHGFFGLVGGAGRLDAVKHLFFRSQDRWRCLDIYDGRLVLAGTDVPAYMREALARGTAPASTLRRLAEVAERFDGRDTVSSLDRPVRLGIDFAVSALGSGLVVAGWLVDPQRHVESVTLRLGGRGIRLDETWTRLARPDVTAAFSADPAYAGVARDGAHGFMGFAAEPGFDTARPTYLELGLRGGQRAFYPLQPGEAPLRATVERVLGLLDPRAAGSAQVVERLVTDALAAAGGAGPRILRTAEYGPAPADAGLSLVIGLDRGGPDLTALLGTLAIDPEARRVRIVLAGPIDLVDEIGTEAGRLARFYGLAVTLVGADGVEDACDAIEAGIGGCETDLVLLLSGSAQPRGRGWLGRLRAAHREAGPDGVVSPTLLFEDDSIRWAGSWHGTDRVTDRLVGYPAEAIAEFRTMEVLAATAECCLLARQAFERCGGFARGYMTTAQKSTDLCLRLREAGIRSVWLPEVALYLTDEPRRAASPFAGEALRTADRLNFERRWAATLATGRN